MQQKSYSWHSINLELDRVVTIKLLESRAAPLWHVANVYDRQTLHIMSQALIFRITQCYTGGTENVALQIHIEMFQNHKEMKYLVYFELGKNYI